jgi:hypothetical protein
MKPFVIVFMFFLGISSSVVSGLSYNQMIEHPDQYKNWPVILSGVVTQTDYSAPDAWGIRLNLIDTRRHPVIFSEQDVFVVFRGESTGPRLYNNDFVTVNGIYWGLTPYITVFGEQRDIPTIYGSSYFLR